MAPLCRTSRPRRVRGEPTGASEKPSRNGAIGFATSALAIAALSASPTMADAKPAANFIALGVERLTMCDGHRTAAVARADQPQRVRVRPKRVERAHRRSNTVLVAYRCGREKAGPIAKRRLSRSRHARTIDLQLTRPGDYRVVLRSRSRGQRKPMRRAAVYLRVEHSVVTVPVSFAVDNINRSQLPCSSDGKRYTIAGRIIAPRKALETGSPPGPVTLYVHEFSFGKFFWSYPERPEYDFAGRLAGAGHTALAIDRLGYDDSGRPAGLDTCLGAQADMVNQVIAALRTGQYAAEGATPPRFGRVALAGHSIGGAVSELVTYSFPGAVDALALMNWADQGFTPASVANASGQGQRCLAGGDPGEPPFYAHFLASASEFRRYMFFDAEHTVADDIVARRNPDPCGDSGSFAQLIQRNQVGIGDVPLPVLIIFGRENLSWDADAAAAQQAQLFASSPETTVHVIDAGRHALPFETIAPTVRAEYDSWLRRYGF